ncbi:hypothetical protein B0H10DRAFT_2021395 [Mycena sp. CBHHK59/15]|nr:hypothetical protein B0H10DRAFT_2021395 [Mycena sp. CBHHK59/15]
MLFLFQRVRRGDISGFNLVWTFYCFSILPPKNRGTILLTRDMRVTSESESESMLSPDPGSGSHADVETRCNTHCLADELGSAWSFFEHAARSFSFVHHLLQILGAAFMFASVLITAKSLCICVLYCRATNAITSFGDSTAPPGPRLPDRTFITIGQVALRDLADFLDITPNAHVSRLLLSDVDLNVLPPTNSEVDQHAVLPQIATRERSCETIAELTGHILNHTHSSLSALSYLTYECDPADTLTSTLQRQLPNLTELTVRAADIWRYTDVLLEQRSLTHLHCAADQFSYKWQPPSLGSVLQQLPNLTHFRVSGPQGRGEVPALDRSPPSIGIGLVEGLAAWVRQTVFDPSLVPINFTLIVRPGPHPGYDAECGFTSVQYNRFVEWLAARSDVHLRQISDAARDYGTGYADQDAVFPVDRAVAEFVDRSRGGEGEWAYDHPVLEDRNMPAFSRELWACRRCSASIANTSRIRVRGPRLAAL